MRFKFIVPLLISIYSLQAHAEWVPVYNDSSESDYADTSTIAGTGDIRQITQLRNFKYVQTPKAGFEHLSKFHVYEFRCSQKTFKVLLTVAYEKTNGQGRPIFKDDIPTPTYETFKPNTATAETWKLACKK